MPITNLNEIERSIDEYIEAQVKRVRQLIIRNLAYVGERCITVARNKGSYKDQTGNLRSSIGYVIVEDGKIINISGFEGNGGNEGRSLAQKLASEYSSGIVLIVVAGMQYASYVSAKGYDVLDSAELTANKLVPKMLDKLGIDSGSIDDIEKWLNEW